MSLNDAFLRAVRDEPDDDTPRLVYADWLEDHAGPDGSARAAFIRAQVRLARLPDDDPARPALEDEADDLLAAHEERWAAGVSPVAREWGWRRGFVECVTVSADDFRAHGGELLAAGPVREVRLTGKAEELAALSGCPHLERVESLDLGSSRVLYLYGRVDALLRSPHLGRLRRLDLSGLSVETPAVRALADSGLLGRLESLQVSGNRALGNSAAGVIAAARPARLEELGLVDSNLTGHGVRALFGADWPRLRRLGVNAGLAVGTNDPAGDLRALLGLPLLSRVRNLQVRFTNLPSATALLLARELADAGRLGGLADLDLSGRDERGLPGYGLDAGAVAVLAGTALPGLRSLDVAAHSLQDSGAAALAGAEFFPRLTRLNLQNNRIGGPGLRALLADQTRGRPALAELNLGSNYAGATGASLIADAPLVGGLTSLSLHECNLGPAGAGILSRSPRLSRLRVLRLAHNGLGDDGVQALAASPHLFRLRELDLSGNGLGAAAAEALLRSPHLARVQRLGLRGADFGLTEQGRLRDRFGPGVVF